MYVVVLQTNAGRRRKFSDGTENWSFSSINFFEIFTVHDLYVVYAKRIALFEKSFRTTGMTNTGVIGIANNNFERPLRSRLMCNIVGDLTDNARVRRINRGVGNRKVRMGGGYATKPRPHARTVYPVKGFDFEGNY